MSAPFDKSIELRIKDPTFQEIIQIANDDPTKHQLWIGDIEYDVAERLGAEFDSYNVPYLSFKYESTWQAILNKYAKETSTSYGLIMAEVDLTEIDHVTATYTLPFQSQPLKGKALVGQYEYRVKPVKTSNRKIFQKLGRSILQKPMVAANPWYQPQPTQAGNTTVPGRITSESIMGRARAAGRFGTI